MRPPKVDGVPETPQPWHLVAAIEREHPGNDVGARLEAALRVAADLRAVGDEVVDHYVHAARAVAGGLRPRRPGRLRARRRASQGARAPLRGHRAPAAGAVLRARRAGSELPRSPGDLARARRGTGD